MLEYIKTILLKVSFDGALFEKELKKGFTWLEEKERTQLKQWCYYNFSSLYLLVLDKVFNQ